MNEETTDTKRLDWLERNLMSLYHERNTCSVDMGGNAVTASLGRRREQFKGQTIRAVIDRAMKELPSPRPE